MIPAVYGTNLDARPYSFLMSYHYWILHHDCACVEHMLLPTVVKVPTLIAAYRRTRMACQMMMVQLIQAQRSSFWTYLLADNGVQ